MKSLMPGIIFVLLGSSASAPAQQQAETRDQGWAAATSHNDRITKEYTDVTVIVETTANALTIYYFSKPSSAAYPTWIRDRRFPDGSSQTTKSCDTCNSNARAFANRIVPSDRPLADGFHELMDSDQK